MKSFILALLACPTPLLIWWCQNLGSWALPCQMTCVMFGMVFMGASLLTYLEPPKRESDKLKDLRVR